MTTNQEREKHILQKLGSLSRQVCTLTPVEKRELTFQAISWTSGDKKFDPEEDQNYGRVEYYIYITGNYNGKSIGVRVTNYKLFFYLSIPDRWSDTDAKNFYTKFIKKKCYGATSYEIVTKMSLYPFTNFRKIKFMKIYFGNRMAMSMLNKILTTEPIDMSLCRPTDEFAVYEAKVDPLNKFCHEKNIKTAGYITIKNIKESDTSVFNTQYSVDIDASDIYAAEDIPTNSDFRILSYDIETQSSTGAFPNSEIEGDYIGQIGISMLHFASSIVTRIIITRGPCDPVEDTLVFATNSEAELLITYCYLIKYLDPDIVTGHNIWNFDDRYIISRMKLLGIYTYINICTRINEDLVTLSYLFSYEKPKTKKELDEAKKDFKHTAKSSDKAGILKKNLSTSARGDNTFWLLIMPGRETIDLLEVVRSGGHNLQNYKLDTIGEHFLKERKVDLPISELFKCLEINDGPSNQTVATYCIQDTNLVIRIILHQLIMQNYIEMAKLTYVPMYWLTTRGQQCKGYSLIVKFANNDGYLVPDIIKGQFEQFQGASVLEPHRGRHYEPVCGLDFASLYPSIMRAHNICLSTIYRPGVSSFAFKGVIDEGEDSSDIATSGTISFEKIKRNSISADDVKTDTTDYFYQPNGSSKQGPIPQILDTLAVWRKNAKNDMAKASDQAVKDIYNSKQLQIKIVMNSLYGFFGSKHNIACIAIASCVTARGRRMIATTAKLATEMYPSEILYGDSIPGNTKVYAGYDPLNLDHLPITSFTEQLEDIGTHWTSYKYFKTEDARTSSKEQIILDGLPVYTKAASGTVKIKRIIRHKTEKKLYKVICKDSGGILHLVIITEGHSLIDVNGYPVDVNHLKIGQMLPKV